MGQRSGTRLLMVHKRWKKRLPVRSLGEDKAYDTRDLVQVLREMQVRPLMERAFGWMKSIGGIRKVKLRGLLKVDWLFLLNAAAFNLWRIPKLKAAEV